MLRQVEGCGSINLCSFKHAASIQTHISWAKEIYRIFGFLKPDILH